MTMFGIIWGTLTVILLLAFGVGVQKQMSKNMHGIGEGIVDQDHRHEAGDHEGHVIHPLHVIDAVLQRDPEDEDVYYWIDWGDDTPGEWIGPYTSGEVITVSHVWEDKGNYEIIAKSKDNSYESEWSDPFVIEIVPLIEINSIKSGFFRLNVVLKNNGDEELTCVKWNINLEGGALIGKESSGEVAISAYGEKNIKSGLILGFGETEITVTIEIPECSDTKNKGGFIYLIYVHVNFGGE